MLEFSFNTGSKQKLIFEKKEWMASSIRMQSAQQVIYAKVSHQYRREGQ